MIGPVAPLTLPSGFNPFLAGERLKEIGERLHLIAAASSADKAQAAWENLFCPRTETDDWCDKQFTLIWRDQTQFVREATRAGIPWEKANATFDSVNEAAKAIRRMATELILWWTPNGREEIIRDRRPREWRDQDVWQIAWDSNHAILERAIKLMFPAINGLDELGRHILDFHRPATTSTTATPNPMPDAAPAATKQSEGGTEDPNWTHSRAPGKMGIVIPRPRVIEQDVRRKVLDEVTVAVEAVRATSGPQAEGASEGETAWAAGIGEALITQHRENLNRIRAVLTSLGKDISRYRTTQIPIAPILGVFASQFGWTPEVVKKLTLYQIAMYLEQVVQETQRDEMEHEKGNRTTSPPPAESDEELKEGRPRRESEGETPKTIPATVTVYVTLDMAAASVQRSKRTLENWRQRKLNPLPEPDIEGGGGKPNEWDWVTLRPWLEKETGRQLPENFPILRR